MSLISRRYAMPDRMNAVMPSVQMMPPQHHANNDGEMTSPPAPLSPPAANLPTQPPTPVGSPIAPPSTATEVILKQDDAFARVAEYVNDKNEAETDPLMLALDVVRKENPGFDPSHAETGTNRVRYQYAWLVKPVQALLRGLLSGVTDFEIVGGLSIFRAPGATAGKKKNPGGLRHLWMKMLPLAIAPDMPFFFITVFFITLINVCQQLVYRVCTSFPSQQHQQHEQQQQQQQDVVDSIMVAERIAHNATWIVGVLTFLALYGGVRAIIREPGYILTENRSRPQATDAATLQMQEQLPGWCRVCKHIKPPRAHHCRLCHCCCNFSDHHCIGLGCEVGLRNYNFFLIFLSSCCFGCIWSLYALPAFLYHAWGHVNALGLLIGVIGVAVTAFNVLWTSLLCKDHFYENIPRAATTRETWNQRAPPKSFDLLRRRIVELLTMEVPPSMLIRQGDDEGTSLADEKNPV